MEHSFGPKGSCHRGFYRELVKEVDTKGDSVVHTSAGFNLGRMTTLEAEKRAAQAAKEANVKPARLYLRSTSRGLRRAVDIYMPLFMQDSSPACSEEDQEHNSGSQPEGHQNASVPAQAAEVSCRRNFPSFHRLGMWKLMDEYVNGASFGGKYPALDICRGSTNSKQYRAKKQFSGSRIYENNSWN
ncbi:hypothetical protein KR054_001215 [Drosophila jambulina]|nr:hypothetical protein KR054_001215 [Drosophila jambulina]